MTAPCRLPGVGASGRSPTNGPFLGGVAINGTLAHVVALLLDRGMPLGAAAGSLAWRDLR